jgi:nitrate reductase NapD
MKVLDESILTPDLHQATPAPTDSVHFASMIVAVFPHLADTVAARIRDLPGADVPVISPQGKLIVTLETSQLGDVTALIDAMSAMQGVVSTSLVYHHIADADELDTLIEPDPSSSSKSPANRAKKETST